MTVVMRVSPFVPVRMAPPTSSRRVDGRGVQDRHQAAERRNGGKKKDDHRLTSLETV